MTMFSGVAGAIAALLLAADPFSLVAPAITLSAADRRALDRGAIVARTLDAGDGQIALFAASRIDVAPRALIEHARAIEDLKRSSFVTAIKRFSVPPRLEDLDELVLSPNEVQAAAACAPGKCSFNLTAGEIGILRDAAAAAGDRNAVIQHAFRQVVLSRVRAYLAGGLRGLPPIVSRATPLCLERVFDRILSASPSFSEAPCVAGWLREPSPAAGGVESFLYWSQERYGTGKPVVLVTHIALIEPASPADSAIVLGKQVFASHYMTGGLAVTAISPDPDAGANHLLYLNRTGVDLLGGILGPVKRAVLESRLKGELPDIIRKLRARLERDARSTATR